MLLIWKSPFEADHYLRVNNPSGKTLGELLGRYAPAIGSCLIDGEFCEQWQERCPQQERIELFLRVGFDPVTWGVTTAFILNAVSAAAIGGVLSIALNSAASALFGPKKLGKETGRPEEVFGIAGLTNTVAEGTPKFIPYGQRRVFGHLIGTKVGIAADGQQTTFGALYFMGEGGTAGIESITEVQLNDTPISSFEGATFETRLGTAAQSPITGFPSASQVYQDGRELPDDPSTITYTTRGDEVDSITLVMQLPYLFNIKQSTGQHMQTKVQFRVEYREVGAGDFTEPPGSPHTWEGLSNGPIYRPFSIALPSKSQWEIRVRNVPVSGGTNENNQGPFLYNVQEERSGTMAYPHNALLAIFGVGSSQITSFESLRASGLVKGRKCQIWDGNDLSTAWTRQRTWIVRDFLTEPRAGLGNRVSADLIDDDSFLDVQAYYDEFVDGETRDLCDILINERRQGWDWLKELMGEGRGAIIPSGGKLKCVVERDRFPNLPYSMPGNILEGSLQTTWGGQGSPPNTIRGEFPDEDRNEVLSVVEYPEDIGTEPVREELVSLRSIVRRSQAYREIAFRLKKLRNVKRRFAWTSPMTALVSEPFDVDSLSYDTVNHKRGISGFAGRDSTITMLYLDRLVSLEPATTYALTVRHLADNTSERKLIATAAGTWGALQPTVDFATAPAEGDIWAFGQQNVHMPDILIEQVTRQDDGTYKIEASQYDATLYESPGPPPGPPPGAPPTPPLPVSGGLPLPLAAAQGSSIVTYGPDGSLVWEWGFSVSPGQAIWAGTVQYWGADYFALEENAPAIEDYFLGVPAYATLTSGTGAGQRRLIIDYGDIEMVAGVREARVAPPWDVQPDAGTTYEIQFQGFDLFWGFDVEAKETGSSDFLLWGTFEGTSGTVRNVDYQWGGEMRVVPVGQKGGRNRIGLWRQTFVSVASNDNPGAISGWA